MLNVFGRQNFIGLTDSYAVNRMDPAPDPREADPLWLAKSGTIPYDFDGIVLTEDSRKDAATRLAKYTRCWNFYKRIHWDVETERGLTKPVMNYCRDSVKIVAEWVIANGFTVTAAKGNEPVAALLNLFWKNSITAPWMYTTSVQYAGITGDSYWMLASKKGVSSINDIAIVPLNPAYCHPCWNTEGNLTKLMMQYTDLEGRLITIYFTKEYTRSYIDMIKQSDEPNLLGELPVVHIPSAYEAGSNFGISELEEIIPLNIALNTQAHLINKIMHYQGSPTTLMFGVRYSGLERMADKIWSNLPETARVENLRMDADLTPHMDWYKEYKHQISRAARIPMFLLEPSDENMQRISNTSGIALEMLYGPIISKVEERRRPLRNAFKQIHRLILKTLEWRKVVDLKNLTDRYEERYDTDVIFGSKLPRDKQAELDVAAKKVAMGIWSKAEAMRRLSEVEDTERLAVELAADKISEVMKQFESQRAVLGNRPTAGFAFIDSPNLTEDLLDLATKVGEITKTEDSSEDIDEGNDKAEVQDEEDASETANMKGT